jgi:hypothetical protein
MSKRKPARPRKARSVSKVRSKAARSGEPKGRANSKQARVLALLCGPNGATIATVRRSTGSGSRIRYAPSWPPWCARSSGLGSSRRRLMASASIGLLPARLPPIARVCRVRSHAATLDRPGRNRG